MVKVLYFAELKELLNKSEEILTLEAPTGVDMFIERLMLEYPVLAEKTFQIAINESFALPTDTIQPQDTIALIPPVSGG